MCEAFFLQPPVIEIGPKAYIYGEACLHLAKKADALVKKFGIAIILTPQYVDIPVIARRTKNIHVFAQHMDSLSVGRGVGSVLPEAIKAAGASGVMLNHAEKRLSLSEIHRAIKRARDLGLATMVCADTPEEARAVACLHPDIILSEAPEMIGTGKWDNERIDTIEQFCDGVKSIDSRIRVLMGAGISTGQDVEDVIRAGGDGVGSSSGIVLAEAPGRVLEEMSEAARRAWDAVDI